MSSAIDRDLRLCLTFAIPDLKKKVCYGCYTVSPCKVAKCQSLTKVLSREPCFLLCEHFHPVQQEPTRFCESYTKLWRESHRVVQCREKMWLAVPLLLFWMLSCRETPVPCQPARSLWTEKSTNSQQNKCLLPSFWVLVILFQQ